MQLTNAVAEMERSYIKASTLCGQILATLNLERNRDLIEKRFLEEEAKILIREIELWNKIFDRDVSYKRFAVLLEADEENSNSSPSGPTTQVKISADATPDGEICHCKHGDAWRELPRIISCTPCDFCPSCGGKILLT